MESSITFSINKNMFKNIIVTANHSRLLTFIKFRIIFYNKSGYLKYDKTLLYYESNDIKSCN